MAAAVIAGVDVAAEVEVVGAGGAQGKIGGRATRRGHGTMTRFRERKSCSPSWLTMMSSCQTPGDTTPLPRQAPAAGLGQRDGHVAALVDRDGRGLPQRQRR